MAAAECAGASSERVLLRRFREPQSHVDVAAMASACVVHDSLLCLNRGIATSRAVGRSLSARFGDGARHGGSGHEFQSAGDLVDRFAVAMEAEPDEVELGG